MTKEKDYGKLISLRVPSKIHKKYYQLETFKKREFIYKINKWLIKNL